MSRQDFDLLRRVEAVPNAEMLLSSHVAYIVRAEEESVGAWLLHPAVNESLFVGCHTA